MEASGEDAVARHYGAGGLEDRVMAALEAAGLDLGALTPADLAPVDEFHMGGRAATEEIVGRLDLASGAAVLDIGCGPGGLVRHLAGLGMQATGLDLTPEFVSLARRLTALTGLSERAAFVEGSALDLPFEAASFDAALTFHVAMNIADRPRMYAEAARVLRPGAPFVAYDVMKGPTPGMRFPVPWAEDETTSFLFPAEQVAEMLAAAGLAVERVEDRTPLILSHHRAAMERAKAKAAQGEGPAPRPVLGLHVIQARDAAANSRNMIAMAEAGQITLHAVFARKPG